MTDDEQRDVSKKIVAKLEGLTAQERFAVLRRVAYWFNYEVQRTEAEAAE